MNRWAVLVPFLAACGFSTPASSGLGGSPDAAVDASGASDGATIDGVIDAQVGCSASCRWGCIMTGTPHCGELVPGGGALMPGDLEPSNVAAIELSGTVDGTTGAIQNLRAAGTGVIAGIGFQIRNGVGIFTVENLHVAAGVKIIGTNPVAFAVHDSIAIDAAIELGGNAQSSGPGGRNGGNRATSAMGMGAGTGGTGPHDNSSGGGGGGNGSTGGAGGKSSATSNSNGGGTVGNDAIAILNGGGGGGGGGGPSGGVGGGGGGALQLSCNGTIQISATGSISAGGGAGAGGPDDSGGGGGAGGTILLEAPSITITGKLAVNGGGGGASEGGSGTEGTLTIAHAAGGTGLATGGDGGAQGRITGGPGGNAKNAAGGGGAAGRIRLVTLTGMATVTGVLSPSLTDQPTSTKQGVAVIQ